MQDEPQTIGHSLLADLLPPDFMNRNYTGPIIKPRLAAQIAFLSIGGTFLATFFVWTATPFISHYYDYLNASLLRLLAAWWFLGLITAAIIHQVFKPTESFRWITAMVMVGVVSIVFFGSHYKKHCGWVFSKALSVKWNNLRNFTLTKQRTLSTQNSITWHFLSIM